MHSGNGGLEMKDTRLLFDSENAVRKRDRTRGRLDRDH
jgi:hypothetical protein